MIYRKTILLSLLVLSLKSGEAVANPMDSDRLTIRDAAGNIVKTTSGADADVVISDRDEGTFTVFDLEVPLTDKQKGMISAQLIKVTLTERATCPAEDDACNAS
jgi:hypothetical protein